MPQSERWDTPDLPPVPELDDRLLSAPRYRFLARRPLWKSPSRHSQLARLGRWQEYSREKLQTLAGCFPFDLWLEEVFTDDALCSEAWLGNRWVSASWWQKDARYLTAMSELAREEPEAVRMAARMRTRKRLPDGRRPGFGEAACHLVDHLDLGRSMAMQVAKAAGFPIAPEEWSNLVRNGRKRLKGGAQCGFC